MLANMLCFHEHYCLKDIFFSGCVIVNLTDMKDDVFLQKLRSERQKGGERGIQVNLTVVNMVVGARWAGLSSSQALGPSNQGCVCNLVNK